MGYNAYEVEICKNNSSQICKSNSKTINLHPKMIVTFNEYYLQVLYTKGTTDKKHRYQPDIIRRYQKCISMIKSSSCVNALARINSLNYEELKGDKKGLSSVRINDQYRLEFKVEINDTEPVLKICHIINISKHYER